MRPLARALAAATDRLAAAGVPSARTDAEELAAFVLGVPRGSLVLHGNLDGSRFDDLVHLRASRVPLQHLTGRAGFRRLTLAVGPGVFVPRPETEVLVEWCLRAAPRGGVVVDLCAGSGAIALAIADERPDLTVYAVEREEAAFAWLRRNAAGSPVVSVRGDAATAVPELDGTVDLVASNPPYVPVDGRVLDPEVAAHDPPAALYAGADGLETVQVVSRAARRLLRVGGCLAVEHADAQGDAVPALLRRHGWRAVADHRDLSDRPRFATASRPGD